MRGGRIARAGRLGKVQRVWDPFPSRAPNLAAFFPAGPPNFGRRKMLRMRRFRRALGRLPGRRCGRRSGLTGRSQLPLEIGLRQPLNVRPFHCYAEIRRAESANDYARFLTINPTAFAGGRFRQVRAPPGSTPRSTNCSLFPRLVNEQTSPPDFPIKFAASATKIPSPCAIPASPHERPLKDAGSERASSRLSAGRPYPPRSTINDSYAPCLVS